jgi:UDP-N-acetylmuramoyl-tripeptide--D-alanyl-D-alanine ligase
VRGPSAVSNDKLSLNYDEIFSVLSCDLLSEGIGAEIKGVSIDSRTTQAGDIFFALHGEKSDGHKYVPDVALKASCCIVDTVDGRIKEAAEKNSCMILKTADTLSALQLLAKYYRSKFKELFVIGITGSSGKTTTKELIASVLSADSPTVMNEGNLNSEIGLPLSVFNIRDFHKYGVFEMGMNRVGEMDILIDVLAPEFGIITNIGTAHIGMLGSKEKIAEEKSKIFLNNKSLETGLIYANDSYAENIAALSGNKVRLYDVEHMAGLLSVEDKGIAGSILHFDEGDISLSLIGSYNVLNAAAAVTAARKLSVGFSSIKKGLENVSALFGRGEIREGFVTVISECYNANLEAAVSAVNFLENLDWKGKKVVLIGSILELGNRSEEIHSSLGKVIAESSLDAAFFYGDEAESAFNSAEKIESSIFMFHSSEKEKLEKELVSFLSEGDVVLFKGSRGMALEQFIKPVLDLQRGGLNA